MTKTEPKEIVKTEREVIANANAATLAGKIAQASMDVGSFKADKTNLDQKYSYISADQVLSRAGDALARNGVVIFPSISEPVIATVERQGKSPRIDAHVLFVMLITDGEKEMSIAWHGYGSDYMTPDKAVYKAITSGHKYFLMKLLNIGVGNEDGEHEMPPKQDAISGNPDPISDKAWEFWTALVAQADALKIKHGNPDRAKMTTGDLRQAYDELRASVEAAQAQEESGG
jgi:hypothetical protein